ncbi:hypothetical protein PPIS_a3639 [Pseudoalteromonas piscicida]|uniref:Uncharacterized protein n=1 Tax=Pseudoalteromonas piscicida TaxID=43662 RepID=A0ABM6NHE3_PSEO7|nr:hypothetical protein PPIS_a3639 [Pseudoalteromonas piscicida]
MPLIIITGSGQRKPTASKVWSVLSKLIVVGLVSYVASDENAILTACCK